MMDPLLIQSAAIALLVTIILMIVCYVRFGSDLFLGSSVPPPSSRWAIDFVHQQTGKRPADDALLPGRAIVCLIHQCEALSARIAILEERRRP